MIFRVSIVSYSNSADMFEANQLIGRVPGITIDVATAITHLLSLSLILSFLHSFMYSLTLTHSLTETHHLRADGQTVTEQIGPLAGRQSQAAGHDTQVLDQCLVGAQLEFFLPAE